MFRCKFCEFTSCRLKPYLQHRTFHSNITNRYWCVFNRCPKSFQREISFRSHLRRIHNLRATPTVLQSTAQPAVKQNRNAKFVCSIELCRKECDNLYNFFKHLKSHIAAHEIVQCPYDGCEKTYSRLNSFTSHLTKKHKAVSAVSTKHTVEEEHDEESDRTARRGACFDDDDENLLDYQDPKHDNVSAIEVLDWFQTESCKDPFLLKVAQMYLKLECKFLLPSSTIQDIVTGSFSTHELSQEAVKDNLKSRLLIEGLTSDNVNVIVDDVFKHDPFEASFNTLNTTYKRRQFYKKEFAYVEPIEVCIEENENEKSCFHYVPIEETLKQLFSDTSLASEFTTTTSTSNSDILRDFTDGLVFRQSLFFKENPEALKLILYQDGFEVVNPIGTAVQKHKLLGIYMSVGNLNDHTRSHVNSIKLVALCKEKKFNHEKVYGRIIEDLKKIETVGIELPSGKIIKGAVVFITGDNLGSHQLGGFVENFSTSTFFCRYCLITRDAFHDKRNLMIKYESRTVQSYEEALKNIGEAKSYHGIKFDSAFNGLTNYHVCTPGLPPCLGHDLLEGVVAFDMKLYVDHLQREGCFSYASLNNRIESFPYCSEDRRDKPCLVSQKKQRIVGGAWQVWMFLKLFPLIIDHKSINPGKEVWRCILLLTEIIEIVCAPAIHKCHLPYLDTIIMEYLELRMSFEPKLRPKHHYLTHYSELILQFGPLMKVWTMRFESKHAYFKRALRFSRNYINITKSMSEKHELLQSFLRCGADIRSVLEMKGNTMLNVGMYNEAIQTALKKIQQYDCQKCDEIVVKGTTYKTGDALFVHQKGYQYGIEIGRISLLLCDEESVFVVCEILQTVFRPHLRAYEVGSCVRYECLPLNDSLPSREALRIYKIGNMLCVKPNHALTRHSL